MLFLMAFFQRINEAFQNFFMVSIPEKYKEEFYRTTYLVNINRIIWLLAAGIIFELIVFLTSFERERQAGAAQAFGVWQWIYLIIIGMFTVFFVLCQLTRLRIVRGKKVVIGLLDAVGCVLLCAVALFFAYNEIIEAGSIATYYLMLIIAATLLYIRPLVSLCVLLPTQAALLYMLIRFAPSAYLAQIAAINATACFIFLFAASRLIYAGRARGFLSQREIERQNDELVIANSKLKNLNRELHLLSNVDALTTLSNRQYLERYIKLAFARAERRNSRLGVLMIDVDKFKAYNDKLGHAQGDQCLMRIAKVLSRVAEEYSGFCARFGGEEFVVLLNSCTWVLLGEAGKALCRGVEEQQLLHPASPLGDYVTVSVGGALENGRKYAEVSDIINHADKALYAAKRQGRNRFMSYLDVEHQHQKPRY